MTVNVLGTRYTIKRVDYGKDPDMANNCGLCKYKSRQIILLNLGTLPGWEGEPKEVIAAHEREGLRHEIIHAFLHESGLGDSAAPSGSAWATNEEMIDWFAIQWPKIAKAFRETGCA